MAFLITVPYIRKDVSDPLAYQPLPRLLDQLFQAPVDIDDPQFGIDRVERVADASEDLFNAPAQLLGELLALAQDLAFEAALLGDVAAFADQKPDVSIPVFDWRNVEVNRDYFVAACPANNIDVVAHELALRCASDRCLELLAGLDRGVPPTDLPKWLSVDIGARNAGTPQRGMVHVPHCALRVEKNAEL